MTLGADNLVIFSAIMMRCLMHQNVELNDNAENGLQCTSSSSIETLTS